MWENHEGAEGLEKSVARATLCRPSGQSYFCNTERGCPFSVLIKKEVKKFFKEVIFIYENMKENGIRMGGDLPMAEKEMATQGKIVIPFTAHIDRKRKSL